MSICAISPFDRAFRVPHRRLRPLAAGALALVLIASAEPAAAVVIELANGQRLEATLRQASSSRIQAEVGGQVVVFEAAEVRAIYFTGAEAIGPPGAVLPPGSTATLPPGSPPGAAPAAATPGPAPETHMPDAAEALETVKALRATVDAGTSATDYSPRVTQARAVVDQFVASASGETKVAGAALGEAMRYYQLAEFAWRNQSLTSGRVWLQRDDALTRCPAYLAFAEEMQTKGDAYYSERTRSFLQISDGVLPVLWSCATDQIAEAEKVIPKPVITKAALPRPGGPSPDTARAAAPGPGSRATPEVPGAPRVDAPRPAAIEADAPRADGPRSDAVRPDAPRPDAPRVDAPRPDAARPEASRPDAPKSDGSRADALRPDGSRSDAPRVDAPRLDGTRPDGSRPDVPRFDAPQPDAVRPEGQRSGPPRSDVLR